VLAQFQQEFFELSSRRKHGHFTTQKSTKDMNEISLPSETGDETVVWRDAAKRHLTAAYADENALYDEP
jgi:hypothetical protein